MSLELLSFSEKHHIVECADVFESYFHELCCFFNRLGRCAVKPVVSLVKYCLFKVYVNVGVLDVFVSEEFLT